MEEYEHHHVKFCEDEKDTYTKNKNCVTIQKQSNNRLQVNLGFLKLNHNYSITVVLHIPEHTAENVQWIPKEDFKSSYTVFKSYELKEKEGYLMVELKAGKSKLMTDLVKLCSSVDSSVQLELALTARVLGKVREGRIFYFVGSKGQGTPMLRDGIHCIGVDADDAESELSDWQGFE